MPNAVEVEVDFEAIRLLTQIALLASWEGLHDKALTIIAGARAWCPHVAQIRNTEALVKLSAGQEQAAVDVLTEASEEFPHDEMTKATLAFVLKQLGHSSWSSAAETVAQWGANPDAVYLARHMLGVPVTTDSDSSTEAAPALESRWG